MAEMAFDPEKAPDEEMIDRQEKVLEQSWADAFQDMGRAYAFYNGEYNIWEDIERVNPDEKGMRPNYVSPRASALIDHAADAALSISPRFHVQPVGKGKENKSKADNVEAALQELFEDAFRWQPAHPPRANTIQLLVANHTILFVGLRAEGIETPPERRDGENAEDFEFREFEWEAQRGSQNPLTLEVPSHGEVLLNPLEATPRVAIRRRRIRAYDLRAQTMAEIERGNTEAVLFDRSTDPYEEIEVVEWWSARWYVLKDKAGKRLYTKRGWGVQPFVHTFGVAATTPIGQDANVKWLVRKGLLFDQMQTIIMHDQAVIGHHALLERAAWARTGTSLNPADAAQRMTGPILQGEEKDFWLEKTPALASGSFAHVENLERIMEQSSYSLQQAGFPSVGTGANTATGAIILSEKTGRKFKLYQVRMGHQYGVAGGVWLRLAKMLAKANPERFSEIGVGEHPLRASDIENYRVQATFENIDQVAFMQEKAAAKEDVKDGLSSRKRYFGVARVENASQEEKDIQQDALRLDPEIAALESIATLREAQFYELADERERRLRESKMAQGKMLTGPDGRTPIGATPPSQPQGENGRMG